jgi:hypothetical protein
MPTNTRKGLSEFRVGMETQSSISVQEGQPAIVSGEKNQLFERSLDPLPTVDPVS